jgi:stage II sporulation protein Q
VIKQNKNQTQNQTTEVTPQEHVLAKGWRRFLAKRWLYPAMYVIVASLMLVVMWAYQSKIDQSATNQNVLPTSVTEETPTDANQDVVSKPQPAEKMIWPYPANQSLAIVTPFFEESAAASVREQAMIEYENTFIPHTGIDFAAKDKQTFEVLSALSGVVTRVDKHPLLGNIVEVTHDNGLITVYQSLQEVTVRMNQEVKQKDRIGKAGRNEMQKDLGVHLHFEVRQNGKAVNPSHWIPEK